MSINRIRLEFKDDQPPPFNGGTNVLIESDWNLKPLKDFPVQLEAEGINRIRLEFKGIY